MGFWTGFGLGGGVAGALDGWDEGPDDADAADCSFARRFRRICTALSDLSSTPIYVTYALSIVQRCTWIIGHRENNGCRKERRRRTKTVDAMGGWGTRITCRQPGPAPAAFFSPTITMFFGRLLATAQACALPGRSFSTTACLGKMKTHQGAKKRWTSLPSGKFKRVRAYTCGGFAAN